MLHSNRNVNRRGFTLVELLVVITIIGILISLLVPTLAAAMKRAREGAVAQDIKQLQMSMEKFKTDRKSKAYPPDFSLNDETGAAVTPANRQTILEKFVRDIAPNSSRTYVDSTWIPDVTQAQFDALDPSEALYFWLALSQKNPEEPLPTSGTDAGWSFFEFEQERLVDNDGDGWLEYLQAHGEEVPYVYFSTYALDLYDGADTRNGGGTAGYPDAGVVRPYLENVTPRTYQAKNGFQIVSAGYDGVFGTNGADKAYPVGVGFEEEDLDNQATFSDGRLDNELD